MPEPFEITLRFSEEAKGRQFTRLLLASAKKDVPSNPEQAALMNVDCASIGKVNIIALRQGRKWVMDLNERTELFGLDIKVNPHCPPGVAYAVDTKTGQVTGVFRITE